MLSTPAYFVGRGYPTGARGNPLDDFQFVHCSFESDGGQIYIDGGNEPLTNFVFENCTFYKPSKPGLIMGSQVAPVLFKNVKINGAIIRMYIRTSIAGRTLHDLFRLDVGYSVD